MQYSTPESCTDQRTETPSSDQLNGEFPASNGYSPDNGTEILRLQAFNDEVNDKKPALNLLTSLHNNPLLAEKLASCMIPGMPTPATATVPLAASLVQTPNAHDVTPTKRKRQRR
ncbi:hypothetical protein ANCDUO_20374 [Ancylostoma duodenale]|uniref:Uncharacterized protein n=1 Tax=Ancylostoma duodenale TaxID=51022 RepID=A0A0C2FXC9_9BILA|nr:hypothetical protein ANCDUO_20374 [Ancylostoma duodenale]